MVPESTEGCTLGLATVWKLQGGVRLDGDDWELCMTVCGGNFSGGSLYLPDLNLCLACAAHVPSFHEPSDQDLGTNLVTL